TSDEQSTARGPDEPARIPGQVSSSAGVAGGRHAAADWGWALHVVGTGFFLGAWMLPWAWALWAALLGAVVLQVQWWLNDVCVLTTLERLLRGRASALASGDGNFLAGLARSIVGRPVPSAWVNRISYTVLWGGAGVAALRLAWR